MKNDGKQCILLVDDEAAITEALSFTLESEGRTLILCSDVEAAEVALARFPVTHLVSDVQFSGEFGFEGLHCLDRFRALAPECQIVLMTGHATDSLRKTAMSHGASAVLAKPFDTQDLEAVLTAPTATTPYEVIRIPSMDVILRGKDLTAFFQPIVRLDATDGRPFAYEALARINSNWLVGGPAMLFEYAERRGKLVELNMLTIERAILDAATLPVDAALFINVDPLTFTQPALVSTIFGAAKRASVALDRLVLEVTERSGFANDGVACDVFNQLRGAGIRFALDDHGSAYSHLAQIHNIRPSFIKISNTFGTAFEQDATKERIVRHTVALARDFGCETILEGIETGATARAAADAGVPLAQGFHFSAARAAAHWVGFKPSQQAA
ncbi:MAG TPA: EAL domain-containing protein [Thermoanaerobaculia bacterium]|jgi:EAL domain-containing protein (putative c-di-GMP-specific phosphodiesterase class I)|nr:EAL domain-containing protein [Thermoanaerobaculia bacterium]